MSRIVAGSARGRRLAMPSGRDTRPTSDRVREALFTSLEAATGSLADLSFLDLYAGSGAVGLEALSRGARPVWMVERDRQAGEIIRRNLRSLGDPRRYATVCVRNVRSLVVEGAPHSFDVVFLDPPYATTSEAVGGLLRQLDEYGWLGRDAIVVVERASRDTFVWPERFAADRERRYGDTTLWYGELERAASPAPPDPAGDTDRPAVRRGRGPAEQEGER